MYEYLVELEELVSCVLKTLGFIESVSLFQLRLQLWEAYCQVRSICSHLRGNDITDSALSTDSSMDESSETLSAKDVPTGSLHASLLELRRLTQNLLDGNESTVRFTTGEMISSQRNRASFSLCVCALRVPVAATRRFWRSRCGNSEKNFENSENCMNKSRRKHAALTRRCYSFIIRSSRFLRFKLQQVETE